MSAQQGYAQTQSGYTMAEDSQAGGYENQLRRLAEDFHRQMQSVVGDNQRHFQCSNSFCPSSSFRCNTCWDISHSSKMAMWIVFGVMILATVAFTVTALGYNATYQSVERVIPFLSASITMVTAIVYLVMATGHGYLQTCPDVKPLFYARYIEWFITTPLLLLVLSFANAMTIESRCFIVFLDIAMIFSGFIGAAVSGIWTKWIFFGFGILCMILIFSAFSLAREGRDPTASTKYTGTVDAAFALLVLTWILYAVLWGLTEGTGTFCRNTETVMYAVLDVVAKVGVLGILNSLNPAHQTHQQVSLVPVGSSMF